MKGVLGDVEERRSSHEVALVICEEEIVSARINADAGRGAEAPGDGGVGAVGRDLEARAAVLGIAAHDGALHTEAVVVVAEVEGAVEVAF